MAGSLILRFKYTLFLIFALLVACTGTLKKPEISLAGVELQGISIAEQNLLLKLRLHNPNDIDLSITALNFDLDLNERHFAKGATEHPVIAPAHGEALLEIKTVASLSTVLKQLRVAQKEGLNQVGYRIYGNIEVKNIGNFSFDRPGSMPLSDLGKHLPK